MNKLDTDPLARASFEKTVDKFIQAAVFSEVDSMQSVSARIMAGQVINGGTGACNIVLDLDMMERSEYVDDISSQYTKTFLELTSNPVIDDIINKVNEIEDDDFDTFYPE
jgi:DNA-directed RNA polymerase beta' subunit